MGNEDSTLPGLVYYQALLDSPLDSVGLGRQKVLPLRHPQGGRLVTAASLVASAIVLCAYGMRRRYPHLLDWANACLWPVVALPAILAGVWAGVVPLAAFGVIGIWAICGRWKSR